MSRTIRSLFVSMATRLQRGFFDPCARGVGRRHAQPVAEAVADVQLGAFWNFAEGFEGDAGAGAEVGVVDFDFAFGRQIAEDPHAQMTGEDDAHAGGSHEHGAHARVDEEGRVFGELCEHIGAVGRGVQGGCGGQDFFEGVGVCVAGWGACHEEEEGEGGE